MFDPTLIGYLAGVPTTAAFAPQVWRAYRTRSTGDISLMMYLVIFAGTSLWFSYGLLLSDPPMVAANGVTLCLQLCVIALKLRYG